ncbi:hypothetical protein FRB95_007152 [Tulasnella sp. JGI-2019a]|nr:hypothetical protein FRB93_013594 [Tulasnella sp. JGI-2019a]KAG9039725.1 hypothetical protein FRB95_007152 [Tulasnella sp. JGI-2019a]
MTPLAGSIVWFEPMINSIPSSTTISITIISTPVSEGPFPIIRHPSISSISITDNSLEAYRWMTHLGEPQSIDGVLVWPLPRLKRLIFDDCGMDADDLIKMVRFRYGKEDEDEGEDESKDEDYMFDKNMSNGSGLAKESAVWRSRPDQLPTPLELLAVSGSGYLDANDFEEPEAIIGAENFVWDNPDEEDNYDDDDYDEDNSYSDMEYY